MAPLAKYFYLVHLQEPVLVGFNWPNFQTNDVEDNCLVLLVGKRR